MHTKPEDEWTWLPWNTPISEDSPFYKAQALFQGDLMPLHKAVCATYGVAVWLDALDRTRRSSVHTGDDDAFTAAWQTALHTELRRLLQPQ